MSSPQPGQRPLSEVPMTVKMSQGSRPVSANLEVISKQPALARPTSEILAGSYKSPEAEGKHFSFFFLSILSFPFLSLTFLSFLRRLFSSLLVIFIFSFFSFKRNGKRSWREG